MAAEFVAAMNRRCREAVRPAMHEFIVLLIRRHDDESLGGGLSAFKSTAMHVLSMPRI
jgi:hypothetical protein